MHGQNRVGELPRLDPARMSHFHAYNYPCERADHEDGEGATRPLGWFAAAYFLAVVVIGICVNNSVGEAARPVQDLVSVCVSLSLSD